MSARTPCGPWSWKLLTPVPRGNASRLTPGSKGLPYKAMELREFFSEDAVQLELQGSTKDEVLKELIGLLKLDEKSEGMLFKMLKRRENLGSTGIGRGIAIPQSIQQLPACGGAPAGAKEICDQY